jgi:hypothetical protein
VQPEPIIVVPPKTNILTQQPTAFLIALFDEDDPKQTNVAITQPAVPLTHPSVQPEPIIVVPPKTDMQTQKTIDCFIAQPNVEVLEASELGKVEKCR